MSLVAINSIFLSKCLGLICIKSGLSYANIMKKKGIKEENHRRYNAFENNILFTRLQKLCN